MSHLLKATDTSGGQFFCERSVINTVKRVLETNKDYGDHFFPHPVQNAIVLLMTRGKIEGEPPFLKPH